MLKIPSDHSDSKSELPNVALPELSAAHRYALFLDFDGTLVDIASRPADVQFRQATRSALMKLDAALGQALAVITGRDIAEIDHYLAPLRLPVAGVHGLNRRDAQGHVHAPVASGNLVADVRRHLEPLLKREPALLIEPKTGAIALHYRACPQLEAECIATMEVAVADLDDVHLMRGKMVIEARKRGASKGSAIADFLSEPPFIDRIPVFAGDDVTDEDAFCEVNARNGISIKVGNGATQARYRVADTDEFLDWLKKTAEKLGGHGETR